MPRYHKYPKDYYSPSPKIYYLSFKGVPFYIGLTKLPLIKRLCDSRKDSKKEGSPKDLFIRKHLNEKEFLDIHLLELVENQDHALFLEEYWIHQFRAWGFVLLNQYKVTPPKRMETRCSGRYTKCNIKVKNYNIGYVRKRKS